MIGEVVAQGLFIVGSALIGVFLAVGAISVVRDFRAWRRRKKTPDYLASYRPEGTD